MSVASEKKRIAKLADNKAYRDAYVTEHVKTSVPLQIRHLREEHTLTQTQLAEKAQTTQTVISRLEDPNYGNLTLNSLLKIAAAFDIGLLVKFVPFSRLLLEFQDLSPKTLSVQSFIEELSRLKELAMERDDRKIDTNISIDTEDHRKYIEIPKNHILKMGGPSIYETLKTRSNMGLVVESTIT